MIPRKFKHTFLKCYTWNWLSGFSKPKWGWRSTVFGKIGFVDVWWVEWLEFIEE
jgi:hypothetical protein